jgi:hypothetical protein
MTAVPARVAGVPELALCVPPDRSGRVPPEVLAAAALAGVDEVWRVGGAQAVAALAFGTESVRPVDVIVGPGNVYVSVAKREVAGLVGVPSAFAGPSEVVVVADATAPTESAAVDVVVPIHKDFHGGHVLIGEQTCVIDLDEARMGDPAFDVAHFCTYLAQLGAPASAVDEFVDAYSAATGWADKGSLAPFRAYTCLKIAKQAVLASGPFRNVVEERRLAIADAALARGTAWVDTPWDGSS